MTFEDQQLLNGWHAAERQEYFDFRQTPEWRKGHLLWTQTHIAQPFLSLQKTQPATSSALGSSSASHKTSRG
jgi:hypothetical protein